VRVFIGGGGACYEMLHSIGTTVCRGKKCVYRILIAKLEKRPL
jgi:hypothetical protein